MIAERVENFILRLIDLTNIGELEWKTVDKIIAWEKIRSEIEKSEEIDLKDYFIDDDNSYCVNKYNGYVMVLNIRYGNAPIFAEALDRYILVIKINDELLPENLSNYDGVDGYHNLLKELIKEIEFQKSEEYIMPDCLYEFMEKIMGENEIDGDFID